MSTLIKVLVPLLLASNLSAGTSRRIVIDAGHGGSDSGATGNGLVEKDLNLDVALRLRDLLIADTMDVSGGGEWSVQMTRSTDVFVSLQGRVDIANSWPAERFISIHHNSFTSASANGTETFSFQEGTLSADLRNKVQQDLVAALGLVDRGPKTANFFVLRETTMPAILSEGGFVTNPGDAAVLANPANRQAAAEAHLIGLQRHYGIAPHVPFPAPEAYCTAKLNSAGCLPQIGIQGSTSMATGFQLTCSAVTGGQFGLMYWGNQAADIPFLGGRLCVGGPIQRTAVSNSGGTAGPNCTGNLATTLSPAYLIAEGISPGSVMYAQFWFRDPFLPTENVGLSAGLQVTVAP